MLFETQNWIRLGLVLKHAARVFKNPRSVYALLVWVKEVSSKADRRRITGAPIAGNVPQ